MEANEKAKLVVIDAVRRIPGIEIKMFFDSSWFGFKADVVLSNDDAYVTFCEVIKPSGLIPKIERPYELESGKRGLRIAIEVPTGWQPPER